MKHKTSRLFAYLRSVFLLIILRPVAFVWKNTRKTYRHLWLVAERGIDARDNGYWFFRYLREEQPQINTCYVINKTSPDYKKVACLGRTVPMGSFRHYLMYLSADMLIGSHIQPAAPDLMGCYRLRKFGITTNGKQVFLQHGIIMAEMKWMRYPNLKVDFFTSGAKREYDYLVSQFGFPKDVVQYTGLCRYDNLIDKSKTTNEILVMPTWRGWNYPKDDRFYGTSFYQHFQSFLNQPQLHDLLKKHDLKLIFYPHIEIQKELNKFSSSCERIIIAGWHDYDVQDLLMRCKMLITDYSSVHFDVGYMEKPMIYYQFDIEDFRKFHYQEGYFSYEKHGFGPVVKTEKALMTELLSCVQNGFQMTSEYHNRLNAFFPIRDNKNCERTFQAIRKLGE